MNTSLASVSFRELSAEKVILVAQRAGLQVIEWGGDVHVPSGDLHQAEKVRLLCDDAGLTISAYGSYYAADEAENFSSVLETARVLGARIIRVWAGRRASAKCSPSERASLTQRLQCAAEMARNMDCIVATEYHANTLTDSRDSAALLLQQAPELQTFWQPPVGVSVEENRKTISELHGRIENVHVYKRNSQGQRMALNDGIDEWREYFSLLDIDGKVRYATLEFVARDETEQLFRDAATLRTILRDE